ncbi:MAG: hypothetical protein QXH21_07355 [Ignisphaera sp.]
MVQAIATYGDDYLEECRAVNRRVSEAVRRASSVNPRTKIVGYSQDTFYIDVSTGNIFVTKVKPDVLEGYLAHENGHRSLFPVSSAGSLAFVSAVGANASWASREEVIAAANVVADVFSDIMMLRLGLGGILSKRVQDFIDRIENVDTLMAFKVLMYRAIELASKENATLVNRMHLDTALEEMLNRFTAAREVFDYVYRVALEFIGRVNIVLRTETPTDIAKVFLNPFTAQNTPYLGFLVKAAVELLNANREMSPRASTGGAGSWGDQQQQGRSTSSYPFTAQTSGDMADGATGIGETDVEGVDIEPGEIDASDVHKAVAIMKNVFGVDVGDGGVVIERLFSGKLRKAVEKLVERIKLLYIQNEKKMSKPSGFRKEVTDLWMYPVGEPDEDSVLKERHKLLWKVEYKEPHPRGRIYEIPSSVPEKVVLVIDESGSTLESFGSSNVLSVEALISMLVVAGIRHRGGAKDVSVMKFSQDASKVYSGGDVVEACTKILVPYRYAGGGTNIVEAVKIGISETTKNSALVVVTDLEIPVDVANDIGRMLRTSIESRRVGFVVFVVVNQKKNDEALDAIKRHLADRNSIVAYISSVDDLEILGNTVISRILRMR